MANNKKTLKSPLSAKLEEVKAKVAGEAQKSLAREVLSHLITIDISVRELKKLMKEILK